VHKRNSIINGPLLIGIVLSIAIHGAALYSQGLYTPPRPSMQAGRTVVHLTLVPSRASRAAAAEEQPEPQPPEPVEPLEEAPADIPVDLRVEPAPNPIVPVEPVVEPRPEPDPKTEEQTASADSIEQDASMIEDKGVTAEARTATAITPVYPRISRRRGEEGTVTLTIQVRADGTAGQIRIVESSGHRRLDEAAVKAAEKAVFTPAMQLGRAVDSETELSFTFQLTDD
jgi:protein TonB